MQCFQKDPNRRVSARKLLKHPWITNAKRSDTIPQAQAPTTRFEDAVENIQKWNRKVNSTVTPSNTNTKKENRQMNFSSPTPRRSQYDQSTPVKGQSIVMPNKPQFNTDAFRSPEHSTDQLYYLYVPSIVIVLTTWYS